MYSFIFDIGGVLIDYNYKKVAEELSVKTGCEYGKVESLFGLDVLHPVETGRITPDEFFQHHVRRIMPEISYKDWIQAYIDNFPVNPYGMELLQMVKAKGRKVYILSNLAEFHKDAIEARNPGFFELCDRNFFSFELGFHKPEAEIYEAVCSGIGEKPENCVFFDDMPANVEGAIKHGILGIHFSNSRIKEIRERVVKLL
ncbi:MAG: HAD family phosphatase [Clostridia bacterium]|nr:HAD family phosphatase [Clostridia bacterium]